MRALAPAWPPNARASNTATDKSFGRRIDRGGKTGGAAADDGDVVELVMRMVA